MSRRASRLPVAVVMLAMIVAGAASAQAPPRKPFAEDTHVLRWLLKKQGFTPLDDFDDLPVAPPQTILIVLGRLDCLTRLPLGLSEFVNQGGAVLLANDRASHPALTALTGMEIFGTAVEWRKDAEGRHRDQADRPFVVPGKTLLADGSVNPFDGVRVATNIPSFLREPSNGDRAGDMEILATLPRGCVFSSFGFVWNAKEPLTFAVGGQRGAGRVVVLADHSVFINEMMLPDDCGNLFFASAALDWLKGPDGRRERVLLVEDGTIQPSFDVKLKAAPPLPPLPPLKVLEQFFVQSDRLLDNGQKKFASKENRDEFNYAVARALGANHEFGLARLTRIALWAMGICLALWALVHLTTAGRHRWEKAQPLLATSVALQRPTAALLEQRHEAQLAAGNLAESARGLARLLFSTEIGTPTQPPDVPGRGWRGWLARRRIKRLWRIAFSPDPPHVRPAAWKRFLADVEAFEHDVARGAVRIHTAR